MILKKIVEFNKWVEWKSIFCTLMSQNITDLSQLQQELKMIDLSSANIFSKILKINMISKSNVCGKYEKHMLQIFAYTLHRKK